MDPANACEALLEQGIQFLSASKLDEACDAFTEAAAKASSSLLLSAVPETDATRLRIVQGRAYGNLANIFGRRHELDPALMFSHKALAVFRDIGEPERAAVVLFNLAVYSERLGKLEEAIKFMEDVLAATADPARIAQATKWIASRKARAEAASETSTPSAPPAPTAEEAAPAPQQAPCPTQFCPAVSIDAACFGDGSGVLPPLPHASSADANGWGGASGAAGSSGGGIATPMLEYGFENLWCVGCRTSAWYSHHGNAASPPQLPHRYADVLARNERETALLEAVDASLKARAAAAEAYARGLAESAVALSAPLMTTGLGIGRALNGAGRAPAGVGAAVRSALSFFTGGGPPSGGGATATASQFAAAAAADTSFGADEQGGAEPHAGVLSGGFDSLHTALAVMRRSTAKVRKRGSCCRWGRVSGWPSLLKLLFRAHRKRRSKTTSRSSSSASRRRSTRTRSCPPPAAPSC